MLFGEKYIIKDQGNRIKKPGTDPLKHFQVIFDKFAVKAIKWKDETHVNK